MSMRSRRPETLNLAQSWLLASTLLAVVQGQADVGSEVVCFGTVSKINTIVEGEEATCTITAKDAGGNVIAFVAGHFATPPVACTGATCTPSGLTGNSLTLTPDCAGVSCSVNITLTLSDGSSGVATTIDVLGKISAKSSIACVGDTHGQAANIAAGEVATCTVTFLDDNSDPTVARGTTTTAFEDGGNPGVLVVKCDAAGTTACSGGTSGSLTIVNPCTAGSTCTTSQGLTATFTVTAGVKGSAMDIVLMAAGTTPTPSHTMTVRGVLSTTDTTMACSGNTHGLTNTVIVNEVLTCTITFFDTTGTDPALALVGNFLFGGGFNQICDADNADGGCGAVSAFTVANNKFSGTYTVTAPGTIPTATSPAGAMLLSVKDSTNTAIDGGTKYVINVKGVVSAAKSTVDCLGNTHGKSNAVVPSEVMTCTVEFKDANGAGTIALATNFADGSGVLRASCTGGTCTSFSTAMTMTDATLTSGTFTFTSPNTKIVSGFDPELALTDGSALTVTVTPVSVLGVVASKSTVACIGDDHALTDKVTESEIVTCTVSFFDSDGDATFATAAQVADNNGKLRATCAGGSCSNPSSSMTITYPTTTSGKGTFQITSPSSKGTAMDIEVRLTDNTLLHNGAPYSFTVLGTVSSRSTVACVGDHHSLAFEVRPSEPVTCTVTFLDSDGVSTISVGTGDFETPQCTTGHTCTSPSATLTMVGAFPTGGTSATFTIVAPSTKGNPMGVELELKGTTTLVNNGVPYSMLVLGDVAAQSTMSCVGNTHQLTTDVIA